MNLDAVLRVAGEHAEQYAPLGARTTYRVGGTARVLVHVETFSILRTLSAPLRESGAPVMVLGNGSNLLVADSGFEGVVIDLGEQFASLEWSDETDAVNVVAGSALGLPVAARRLADAGVVGFEWAVGVPGTVGGAAVMNAGGHGSDMAHCVESVETWSLDHDEKRTWTLESLGYRYRHSLLGPRDVVTSVRLRLAHGDAPAARVQISEIVKWRRANQPGGSNAGSVFRNPPGDFAGRLIDEAGCKGLRVGSAQVSEKHANFFQVDDGGSADDVVSLMSQVRAIVADRSGVVLESELRLVGFEGRWP